MDTDDVTLYERAGQNQTKRAALRQHSNEALTCLYCDCQPFYDDKALVCHVRRSHHAQIPASEVQEITSPFWTLLKDEALHKARQTANVQRQLRLGGPGRGGSSLLTDATLDLTMFSLQSKIIATYQSALSEKSLRAVTAVSDNPALGSPDGFPVHQNDEPIRDHGMDSEAKPRIVGEDAMDPEKCWKNLPHPFAAATGNLHLGTERRVTAQDPRVQSPRVLHYRAQQQDPERETGGDDEPFSSSTALSSSPLLPWPSYRVGALPKPTKEQWPDLVLQPDSRPISQEQLAAEVKSLYAGLRMVEVKCMSVRKTHAPFRRDHESGWQPSLPPSHWQALVSLHKTLLDEHHDFFLASQHHSASPVLYQLAAKYSMPARLWKHGIHSFLELLRCHLPESLEYMLTFIHLAYQMIALLMETVPAFEDAWIECLGGLSRFRMEIEDRYLQDSETWMGIARYWYSKASDKSPAVGRFHHHLAIVATPNPLRQLYFFCRSLTCVRPFAASRESIRTFFDPILGRPSTNDSRPLPTETSFVRAHGLLFRKGQGSCHTFEKAFTEFSGQLDNSIRRAGLKWKEHGSYMAIANIASLFDYGREDSFLRLAFETRLQGLMREQTNQNDDLDGQNSHPALPPPHPVSDNIKLDLRTNTTFPHACRLAFSTLNVVLQHHGDENVLAHLHILLAFLCQLVTLPHDTSYILDHVQWDELAFFLNALAKTETITQAIESSAFVREGEEGFRPLPEDYPMGGQIWAHAYYPATWFSDAVDEEERVLELASTTRSRAERILWLGIRLASTSLDLTYDYCTHTWSTCRSEDYPLISYL